MAPVDSSDVLAQACAAGLGGFLSTSILYPLDTLKTRIQSKNKAFPISGDVEEGQGNALNKVDSQGVVMSLYRGIQYKAAEATVSKFLYFYAYTFLSQASSANGNSSVSTGMDLLLGYLSEISHRPLTIPMEVIATRLQTSNEGSSSVADMVSEIASESGISGFYKGLRAYLILGLQPAIQYTLFQRVKTFYLSRYKRNTFALTAIEAFVLGAIARSIATIILFPYIRAKVLAQTQKNDSASVENALIDGQIRSKNEESTLNTLRQVYQEDGVVGLYQGLGPEIMRGAMSAALMLMIKEKLQTYITFLFVLAKSF
uniref:Mitochondrial Carrier (MC) Family putative n=1 Tax=Albugo laibachii Nc14 TaxID=890382 RepID=F0VYT0_9STRA|nr:Mitochondrial Carrier (MC) Family putative [Albugo laibachii Nc14]|eukprot:CCA13945.1 Mitochondrial Carrier (MC) Family putative [Albugo laibachii Nc14]